MRNYHDPEGLGDLPVEKFDQTEIEDSIWFNYKRQYRKFIVKVRCVFHHRHYL